MYKYVNFNPKFNPMKIKPMGIALYQTIVICLFLSKTVFAETLIPAEIYTNN